MTYPNPHAPSCPWHDITETTGAPNIKWCEETLCQWVSEPANTWSNLGYIVAGIIITYLAYKNKHNANLKQFGVIVIFMGAMSLFYHQSNFYGSQLLDFIGMFFFVGWAIGMNLIRMGKVKSNQLIWFNLGLASVLLLLVHAMYVSNLKFQVLVLISGLVIIATEIMIKKITVVKYNWYFATLFFLIVAYGFQYSDGKRLWCNPSHHGWFSQGHAMWHWVACIAMVTMYKFYSQSALKPQENS